MRAVWLREFGPPGVLTPGEAPEPSGDVIEVEYANLTFVKTAQIRAARAARAGRMISYGLASDGGREKRSGRRCS